MWAKTSLVLFGQLLVIPNYECHVICTWHSIPNEFSFLFKNALTLKIPRGGMYPLVMDMACIPSIFIKTVQKNLGESWHQPSFPEIVANLLRIIEICHRGCWKWSFIFRMSHHSQKHMLPKAMIRWIKNLICQIFHEKKIRKFWWKLMKWRIFF